MSLCMIFGLNMQLYHVDMPAYIVYCVLDFLSSEI